MTELFNHHKKRDSVNVPNIRKKYVLNDIPASFLNCEDSHESIVKTIENIEKSLHEEANVSNAYSEFMSLVRNEMVAKLKVKKVCNYKSNKSMKKAYWNEELQLLWNIPFGIEIGLRLEGRCCRTN